MGGRSAQRGHCITEDEERETPSVPWSRLRDTQQAARQFKWLQFTRGFLSIITTGVHVSFLCKERVMKDSVTCICKATPCSQQCLALRGCLLPCRPQVAIRVILPRVEEALGSLPYRRRLDSPPSTARQGGRSLVGAPGPRQRPKLLGLHSPFSAAYLLAMLVVLKDHLLSMWCDAKAFRKTISERKEQQFNNLYLTYM